MVPDGQKIIELKDYAGINYIPGKESRLQFADLLLKEQTTGIYPAQKTLKLSRMTIRLNKKSRAA